MANSTKRTVVGVFDDYASARSAAQELAGAGIAPEAVHVQSNLATGAAGHGAPSGTERPGGISGFFERLLGGGSKDEAGHYAEAVRRGKTVMAIMADEGDVDRITEIMNQHGASDIDRHVENFRLTGYTTFDPNAPAYTHDEAIRERDRFREGGTTTVRGGQAKETHEAISESGRSIPVVEEEVKVGKRTLQRGAVRVYTHVVEEPVSEEVRLREERANIERRKVDRPVRPGDEAAFRDQTVEVTETAEEPVISKSARVKEEIVVSKQATERTENVHDTVRRTEVHVEGQGIADHFRRDYDEHFARTGKTFESFRPAYEFGYEKAREAGHRGQSWATAEPQLEKEFRATGESLKWSDVREAIRRGWEYGKAETVR